LTYGLTTTPKGVEAALSCATRDEFYRDAVAATLEVAYGGIQPTGTNEGAVVPIQAAGGDDIQMLRELVGDCLLAVGATGGTLHSPRWLSFDSGRVTANLPATNPGSARRNVSAVRVLPASGTSAPFAARILYELGAAH